MVKWKIPRQLLERFNWQNGSTQMNFKIKSMHWRVRATVKGAAPHSDRMEEGKSGNHRVRKDAYGRGRAPGRNYQDTLRWCLQLPDHPGLRWWFGKPWCLVTKNNSRNWLYLEWGRSLESWGECRHSTLWQGGGRYEGIRALTRPWALLREAPTKPQQCTRKNCSAYYFSADLEQLQEGFCGKGPDHIEKLHIQALE